MSDVRPAAAADSVQLTASTPPYAAPNYVVVCTCGRPCPMHGPADETRSGLLNAVDILFDDPSPVRCVYDDKGVPIRWTFDGQSWYGSRTEAMGALIAAPPGGVE